MSFNLLCICSIDWIKAGKGEHITAALDKEMDDYQMAAKTAKDTGSA
jgi:hypothetical protein